MANLCTTCEASAKMIAVVKSVLLNWELQKQGKQNPRFLADSLDKLKKVAEDLESVGSL